MIHSGNKRISSSKHGGHAQAWAAMATIAGAFLAASCQTPADASALKTNTVQFDPPSDFVTALVGRHLSGAFGKSRLRTGTNCSGPRGARCACRRGDPGCSRDRQEARGRACVKGTVLPKGSAESKQMVSRRIATRITAPRIRRPGGIPRPRPALRGRPRPGACAPWPTRAHRVLPGLRDPRVPRERRAPPAPRDRPGPRARSAGRVRRAPTAHPAFPDRPARPERTVRRVRRDPPVSTVSTVWTGCPAPRGPREPRGRRARRDPRGLRESREPREPRVPPAPTARPDPPDPKAPGARPARPAPTARRDRPA